MTVSDQQMQAVNVINQHAQFLLRELEASDRDKRVLRTENATLESRLREAQRTPSAKQYRAVVERKAELETENRELRHFMHLKDQSKMKVEGDRDKYKRQAENAEAWQKEAMKLRHDLEEQKNLNTTQAQAYKALEERHRGLLIPRTGLAGTSDVIKSTILTQEVNLLTAKLQEAEAAKRVLTRERDEARREMQQVQKRLEQLKTRVAQAVDTGERWDMMGR